MKARSRLGDAMSVTDLFCGAGGSSLGAEAAGATLRMAANHWSLAIETHNSNFPDADHDCADISQVNPRRYPSTRILIASPECTNHSMAKGRARAQARGQLAFPEVEPLPPEAEERSRATMWDVPRFAEYHGYEIVVVENVVDAHDWVMYPAWLHAMSTLGYEHREVFLNSMFVEPTPQSRDRMYVVFWRIGNLAPDLEFRPQSWCGGCGEVVQGVQTWKNQMRRFGRYRQQYTYTCSRCHQHAYPFATPAMAAIDWSLKGQRIGDRKRPLAEATMGRIGSGIDKYWGEPAVIDTLYGHKARGVDEPLLTQTTRQSQAVYVPLLAQMRGTSSGQIANSARSVEEPLGVVTAGGPHQALVEAPGSTAGPARSTGAPRLSPALHTANAQDRPGGGHPPLLVPVRGNLYARPPYTRTRSVDDPFPTQTTDLDKGLLTPPALVDVQRTNGRARSVAEPLATVVAGTVGHALVIPPGTHGRVAPDAEPLPTQTTTTRPGLLEMPGFMYSYYSSGGQLHGLDESVPTVTTVERHAVVQMPRPAIEDCLFRMLEPHEIGRAMAFPDDYLVLGCKRERVRLFGNAVTPPVMHWLLQRCIESLGRSRTGRAA